MATDKQLKAIHEMTEFLIYTTPNGKVKVEAFIYNENVWLTQKNMGKLFGVESHTVNYHLKQIFVSQELQEEAVTRKIRATANDGKIYNTNFYNLEAIISVGYRVNSTQATHFRMWATQTLKEYIIKGYVMNDERLKDPHNIFGKDYFEEQLARIREIRASERQFYQKITDIYATALDYNPDDEISKNFFATVQNKLHFAIHGNTAAEVIMNRADSKKDHMGLTTWKNAPHGKIVRTDVGVAKNYLTEKELKSLERYVTMYLDYAEDQAL